MIKAERAALLSQTRASRTALSDFFRTSLTYDKIKMMNMRAAELRV